MGLDPQDQYTVMICRKHSKYIFCILLLCVVGFFYRRMDERHQTMKGNVMCEQKDFVLQRNQISILLNQKQQLIGQMKCQLIGNNKTIKWQTSETGGWCAVATKTKHFGFDEKLAGTLAHFFKGKTVGSFGDGPGKYKQTLLATGLVEVYDAYDGAPFCENTSNGAVQFLDLSIPQYGLPVYNWIMSLEVAEHIPQQFENFFFDNLVRHAQEGVILSWAKPGQMGYSHVNNRDSAYVSECMNKFGFLIDNGHTYKIRNGTINNNLKRNINVYVRKVNQTISNLICNA